MNEIKEINEIQPIQDDVSENPDEDTDFYGEGVAEPTQEDIDAYSEKYGVLPQQEQPLGGIYSLFQSVLNKKDSTKVSNLSAEELGSIDFNVRGSLMCELLGNTLGQKVYAKFFKDMAKVVTDTAMAKDGWFTTLFVTSKKEALRQTTSNVEGGTDDKKKKRWRMFSRKE